MEKMFKRKNQDLLSEHYAKLRGGLGADDEEEEGTYNVGGRGHAFSAASGSEDDDDDDESLGGLLIKKDQPTAAEQAELDAEAALSRKKAALINKKKYQAKVGPRPTKLVFDDDGEAHDIYEFDDDRRLTKEQLAKAAEVGRVLRWTQMGPGAQLTRGGFLDCLCRLNVCRSTWNPKRAG